MQPNTKSTAHVVCRGSIKLSNEHKLGEIQAKNTVNEV